MTFHEFWENLNEHIFLGIKELFADNAVHLLQCLLNETMKEGSVDVGIASQGDSYYAILNCDPYNSDKCLCLRLHAGDRYDLYLECYVDDKFESAVYPLTITEIKGIPEGLRTAMQKACTSRQTVYIKKGTLQGPTE